MHTHNLANARKIKDFNNPAPIVYIVRLGIPGITRPSTNYREPKKDLIIHEISHRLENYIGMCL